MNDRIYYHFTGATLRDGKPIPPIGEWLKLPESIKIKPCPSASDIRNGYGGLHASPDPFDALQYAPGNMLHQVYLGGETVSHGDPIDKFAARERQIVATLDATEILCLFARRVALDVIHLWDAPVVVKEYLETGDESKRAARAAWAAGDAARAARDAAWAAGDAARAARDAGDAARAARDAKEKLYRGWFNEMVETAFAMERSKTQ